MAAKLENQLKKFTKENKTAYGSPKLHVAEADGSQWYTESHFAVRIADERRHNDPCVKLLGSFNLETAPGTYEVNGTVRKVSDDPPKLSAIVEPNLAGETIERLRIEGVGDVFAQRGDLVVAIFAGADQPIGVRADYLDFVAEIHAIDRWTHVPDERGLKPLVGWVGPGAVAVVMPYRPT